jgi:hypothetical protein
MRSHRPTTNSCSNRATVDRRVSSRTICFDLTTHSQMLSFEDCTMKTFLSNDELINQNHPLFIGKFLGSEARYEHGKISNRMQYIEKHFAPPLITSKRQYAGGAVSLILQGCAERRREGQLKYCYFRARLHCRRAQLLFVARISHSHRTAAHRGSSGRSWEKTPLRFAGRKFRAYSRLWESSHFAFPTSRERYRGCGLFQLPHRFMMKFSS